MDTSTCYLEGLITPHHPMYQNNKIFLKAWQFMNKYWSSTSLVYRNIPMWKFLPHILSLLLLILASGLGKTQSFWRKKSWNLKTILSPRTNLSCWSSQLYLLCWPSICSLQVLNLVQTHTVVCFVTRFPNTSRFRSD